jgi:hypothetical protein
VGLLGVKDSDSNFDLDSDDDDKDMAEEMSLSEARENEGNVRLGIVKQAEFTKGYVSEVVNRLVTDTTLAAQVISEINAKLDARDAKFLEAVDNEFNEVDVDADAEALTKDLLAG